MTAVPANLAAQASRRPPPPLVNGDRLTRDEFERRYNAAPPGLKAELIEGVVYIMASPVSEAFHGTPHLLVAGWISWYLAFTPGLTAGDNSTVRLDLDNEPQPDAHLRIRPDRGGQSRTDEGGYVRGAPELCAEISASSSAIDLHAKLQAYRRNGVREYIVLRTYDQAVDWFVLRGSDYVRLDAVDGVLRSEVFPGLWLDVAALLAGRVDLLLQTLQRGLATPEHAAFVARMNAATSA
jgi:Uma2 family endonuclease